MYRFSNTSRWWRRHCPRDETVYPKPALDDCWGRCMLVLACQCKKDPRPTKNHVKSRNIAVLCTGHGARNGRNPLRCRESHTRGTFAHVCGGCTGKARAKTRTHRSGIEATGGAQGSADSCPKTARGPPPPSLASY